MFVCVFSLIPHKCQKKCALRSAPHSHRIYLVIYGATCALLRKGHTNYSKKIHKCERITQKNLHIYEKSATFAALFTFYILQIMVNLQTFTQKNLHNYRAKVDLHWNGRYFTSGDGLTLSDVFTCDWFPDWLYLALVNQDEFYCYTDFFKVRKYYDHITIFYGKKQHY